MDKVANNRFGDVSTHAYSKTLGMDFHFPFTSVQWRELERQSMIYKYLMYSLPVPPDLLFPLSRNLVDSSSVSSLYSLRRNGDAEPGRCKRTDGKKWRCSREVAPHQKYCERHLNRGRPRSRKPVEVKNNNDGKNHKKVCLEQKPAAVPMDNNCSLLLFNGDADVTSAKYCESNRNLELMMQQRLMESNMLFDNDGSIYGSNPLLDQDYLNAFTYSNRANPTDFIDAWSIYNVNSTGNPEPSSSMNHMSLDLSIAMASDNEEIGAFQIGGGVKSSGDMHITKDFLTPECFEPFPFGPLAEALQGGPVALTFANPASPRNSFSTPATTVSSPSGVLQRMVFSHSDSVCNSPTVAAQSQELN